MPDEMLTVIISAITSAIISGIMTLLLDIRKERRQDKKEQQKEKQKIYEERPELQIIEYEEYIDTPGQEIEKECDINVFMTRIDDVWIDDDVTAHYNNAFFNKSEWCSVIYTFKNVGKTDVRCVSPICTDKKHTMLCNVSSVEMILKYGVLSYSSMYDRKIRVGETFTLKICYHKDCIITGELSAIMVMALEDSNSRFWEQSLFAPDNKIYEAHEVTREEYRNDLLPDIAKECFKKPWLW